MRLAAALESAVGARPMRALPRGGIALLRGDGRTLLLSRPRAERLLRHLIRVADSGTLVGHELDDLLDVVRDLRAAVTSRAVTRRAHLHRRRLGRRRPLG